MESRPTTPGAGTHLTELQGAAPGGGGLRPFLYPLSLTQCRISASKSVTILPTEPRGNTSFPDAKVVNQITNSPDTRKSEVALLQAKLDKGE